MLSKDLKHDVKYKPKAAPVTAKIDGRNGGAFTFITSWLVHSLEFKRVSHLLFMIYQSQCVLLFRVVGSTKRAMPKCDDEEESVCKQEAGAGV